MNTLNSFIPNRSLWVALRLQGGLLVLFATLLFTAPSMVFAGPVVDSTGQLTGATSVIVNDVSYNVEFLDGTCVDLFDGCDDLSDFTFTTVTEATAAAQALLDSVFQDGPHGLFDTNPSLTNGCSDAAECDALIPFGFSGTLVRARIASNHAFEVNDSWTGSGVQELTRDTTGKSRKTYA